MRCFVLTHIKYLNQANQIFRSLFSNLNKHPNISDENKECNTQYKKPQGSISFNKKAFFLADPVYYIAKMEGWIRNESGCYPLFAITKYDGF